MLETNIHIQTQNFDGPLGLLLHLIQRDEMDIKDLDLNKMTQQYLNYLVDMKELNFDIAGDYLYMASTLLFLKSKKAVSEEEGEALKAQLASSDLNITSESELVRRLEELQRFQKLGEMLWKLPKKGHEIFVKPKVSRKSLVDSILLPMDLEKLTEAMMDFIVKERRKYTVIKRDRLSIKEKLIFLKEELRVGEQAVFDKLLELHGDGKKIDNIVITFISLLELARLKKVNLFQESDDSTLFIDVVKTLDDFDVESANGFDEEEGNSTPSEDELKQKFEAQAEPTEITIEETHTLQ